jgi:hypothetical protein
MRTRAAVATAVGVAAGTAAAAAVRRRRPGIPAETGERVHTVTVLAPLDLVRDAWPPDGDVEGDRGQVDLRPAPGDRGTEVRVSAGDGGGELREELRRLKSRLECGEVVTTEDQPTGRTGRKEALTRAVTDRLRSWSPA